MHEMADQPDSFFELFQRRGLESLAVNWTVAGAEAKDGAPFGDFVERRGGAGDYRRVTKDDVGDGNAEKKPLGYHGATGKRLE